MSEKITRLIASYILNQGVKGSELTDWHFKVRQVDGVYYFDVTTTVAVTPKTQLTRREKRGKALIIAWAISFCIMVALSTIGVLLPDANLGRQLVLYGTIPGFLAQLIGARLLIKGYDEKKEEELRAPSVDQGRPQKLERPKSSPPL